MPPYKCITASRAISVRSIRVRMRAVAGLHRGTRLLLRPATTKKTYTFPTCASSSVQCDGEAEAWLVVLECLSHPGHCSAVQQTARLGSFFDRPWKLDSQSRLHVRLTVSSAPPDVQIRKQRKAPVPFLHCIWPSDEGALWVDEPLAVDASLDGQLLEEVVHPTASSRVHAGVVHVRRESCRHALESSNSFSDISVRWQCRVEVVGSGEVNTDERNVFVLEPATGRSQPWARHRASWC
eukprot:scaffold4882_cov70-Phaeocystis_antarctica.AAC.8